MTRKRCLLVLWVAAAARGFAPAPVARLRQASALRPKALPSETKGGLLIDWPDAIGDSCEVDYADGARPDGAATFAAGALIAGTTVGAGILALPATTLPTGFVPSAAVLVAAWAYMGASGLLIAETTVNVVCELRRPGLGLLATAERVLGPRAAAAAGLAYVFIHYALLVAYLDKGGAGLLPPLAALAHVPEVTSAAPPAAGAALFAAGLGGFLFVGAPAAIEAANSAAVLALIVAFGALLAIGAPGVEPARLLDRADWSAAPATVPIAILSLVFHNVVPVVATRLRGDAAAIRAAVLGGSAVPLVMFLLWNAVILGNVDDATARDAVAAAAAGGGVVFDPLEALRAGAAGNAGESGALGVAVAAFSELAVITSFVGFVVGLRDFYTDLLDDDAELDGGGLDEDGLDGGALDAELAVAGDAPGGAATLTGAAREVALFAIILGPPLGVVALGGSSIFFKALDVAGTFGISTLFGILPAAMAWQQRYGEGGAAPAPGARVLATPPSVPGGRVALALVVGVALVIVGDGTVELVESFVAAP